MIREREIERQEFLKNKKNLPPNSQYFDVRSSPSRSTTKGKSKRLKSVPSIHQQSLRSLTKAPKKILSFTEKQEYVARIQKQQSQAESIKDTQNIEQKLIVQKTKISHLKGKDSEINQHQNNKLKREKLIQLYKEKNLKHKLQLLEKAGEKNKQHIDQKRHKVILKKVNPQDYKQGIFEYFL